MALPSFDPSECYELSDFGFGPFPSSGGTPVCPPHPPGEGYGGSAYGFYPYGDLSAFADPNLIVGGYGGIPYGHGSYGASDPFPRPDFPVDGGYGGDPYGFGPYGTIESTPPRIASAISLDGFRIEIFFDEEMYLDAALTDPLNYVLTPLSGAAPSTVTSVEVGVMGTLGATSVIITHTGTTLGGTYQITVTGPTDISGNPIEGSGVNTVNLLTKGDPPAFTATPLSSGDQILLQFDQAMAPESTFAGIEDTDNYEFTSSYPVTLTATNVTHPNSGDDTQVLLDVQGQTSVDYTLTVEPATAIEYDGSVLPDADPGFVGTEVGTGTSSIQGGDLVLAKTSPDTYGWDFADTTGKIAPGASFRVDFTFDASVATYDPALFDAVVGALHINDGAVEVSLFVERVAGQDVITVVSGALSASVNASWSTGETTISLVRNQLADTYTLLLNGTPLYAAATAGFTGVPTVSVGAQFVLGSTYTVSNFAVISLTFTSSLTVFSAAWNFLHNQTASFTGSAALTVDRFLTQKGPLVKGWGDATPATKNDVTVDVNGVEVEVASVNPYIGEIVLAVPIPKMPAGSITVDIDYIWFPSPVMAMAGLNTPGLVLNKWDLHRGWTHPAVSDELGALDTTSRFPMGIVLGPIEPTKPLLVGHRYLGFERTYTASLNSPTQLLLNQNPHSIAVQTFEESPVGVTSLFDGTASPETSDPAWELEGVDTGSADPVGGVYTLVDASAGSYEEGTAAVYSQEVDLSFPTSVVLAGRFFATQYTLDGVFSGLGFGVHNNRRLFLVGLLEINGARHIGILRDLALPHKYESWTLGPTREVTIVDGTTGIFSADDFPTSVEQGNRFQILAGPQSGVYIIDSFVVQTDGTVTVTLDSSTPFPEDPYYFGNDKADAVFEIDWVDVPSTYRMVVDTLTGNTQLFVSGEISALAIELESMPEVALTAQTLFLLSTEGEGEVFFGSLGRIPTNTSVWSFFRYGTTPQQTTFHDRGVVVSSEMGVVPEDDPNSEWFRTQDFGFAEVAAGGGDVLLLKSGSAEDSLDLTYGYKRVEPFFEPIVNADFDARVRVDTQTRGSGDAVVFIHDRNRLVRFGTLMYREDAGKDTFRQLFNLPTVSLSGLLTPTNQGWSESSGNDLTASARGQIVTTTQEVGQSGTWFDDLDLTELDVTDEGGRIIEARLAVTSYTSNASGNTGILLGGEAGVSASPRTVALTFLDAVSPDPARVALTSNGTPVQTYEFDWTDGLMHVYRILVDASSDTVTLVIDDVVQVPTVSLLSFDASTLNTMLFLGAFGLDTAHTVEWDYAHTQVRAPSTAKRTLGIWLGGDLDDIDNWAIPRTDTTEESNSTSSAVIEEMDWRSDVEFRLHRDAQWGVTLLRPDLPLPPGWDGQFATEITEPSAGWVTVEYPKLPILGGVFGSISWGALDPKGISQQRWDFVRYRLFTNKSEDFRSPHNHVLNQFNVVHSGERTKDCTSEVVSVVSLSSTVVSLIPTNNFAELVYRVIDGDEVIPFEQWRFDKDSQTIFLDQPLSGEKVPVVVVFGPGGPVTTTYLKAQPLLDSLTLLNEGTPPIPKQQTADSTAVVQFGSQINDTNDTLNVDPDFILNDPYRFITHQDDPESLYQCMEFIELDNEGQQGLLSSICDDSYPDHGLLEIGFEGLLFSDIFPGPGGEASFGGDSGSLFEHQPILHWSGGNFVDGTWGPGTAILYPNWPATGVRPGEGIGGVNRRVSVSLRFDSVIIDDIGTEVDLEDDASLSPTADNTPPSYSTDPDLVPNGTPGTNNNGAALLVLETPAEYTRWGPWGGLESLESTSLLAGGEPLPTTGTAFTWAGGTALPGPTITVIPVEAAN